MKPNKLVRLFTALLLALVLCLACACDNHSSTDDSSNQDDTQSTPSDDQDQEGSQDEDKKDPSGSEGQGSQGQQGSQGSQGGDEKDPSGSESQGSQGQQGSQGDQGGDEKEPSGSEGQGSQGQQGSQGSQEGNEGGEIAIPEWKGEWVSAIFGGGPFVEGKQSVLDDVTSSGFNTIMIWSVHIHGDGTLYLNNTKAVDNGELVIGQASVEFWSKLKGEGSSIERIELSVGAGGCTDFEEIKKYVEKEGTGEESVLYKNMHTLIEATGADAVNFDDESCYDLNSAAAFGKMCAEMGMKITFCPYVNIDFWSKLAKELGEDADRVYLQCYSGGQLNDNQYKTWWRVWALSTGMRIIPGYWCGTGAGRCMASTVKSKLSRETDYTTGGFMWLYDDMMKMKSPNSTKDYAAAINEANPHKDEETPAEAFMKELSAVLPEKKRG